MKEEIIEFGLQAYALYRDGAPICIACMFAITKSVQEESFCDGCGFTAHLSCQQLSKDPHLFFLCPDCFEDYE